MVQVRPKPCYAHVLDRRLELVCPVQGTTLVVYLPVLVVVSTVFQYQVVQAVQKVVFEQEMSQPALMMSHSDMIHVV